jgi:hypothetical protein
VPQQSEHKKNQKKKKDNLGNASRSAIPPNPNKAASKATMKNPRAQRSSIVTSWRNVKFNEQLTEIGSLLSSAKNC